MDLGRSNTPETTYQPPKVILPRGEGITATAATVLLPRSGGTPLGVDLSSLPVDACPQVEGPEIYQRAIRAAYPVLTKALATMKAYNLGTPASVAVTSEIPQVDREDFELEQPRGWQVAVRAAGLDPDDGKNLSPQIREIVENAVATREAYVMGYLRENEWEAIATFLDVPENEISTDFLDLLAELEARERTVTEDSVSASEWANPAFSSQKLLDHEWDFRTEPVLHDQIELEVTAHLHLAGNFLATIPLKEGEAELLVHGRVGVDPAMDDLSAPQTSILIRLDSSEAEISTAVEQGVQKVLTWFEKGV